MNAGRLLVSMLEENGVDRVFCVPGESYLPIFDALLDSKIDCVVCHHESSAGFMAVMDSRITGRVGAAFVSRGPGATNASIAVHTAQQDAVPFILFIGQVERKNLRRGAFQEIDYGKMFGDIAKWVAEVRDPELLAEVMAKAIHVASTDTKGPVVIVLPEDVLYEPVSPGPLRRFAPIQTAPSQDALDATIALLREARRPLIIAGGELEHGDGRQALLAAAEAWSVPVSVSFRRHDLFPNEHPLFAGDLGIQNSDAQMAAMQEADLILAIGTRLGDLTTHGYTFPQAPWPNQKLVHVYNDPAVIGTHFRADVGAACGSAAFLARLAEARPNAATEERTSWIGRLHGLRTAITTWTRKTAPDGVVFGNVVASLAKQLKRDAIVTLDAGMSAAMLYKQVPWQPPQLMLATIAGVMGAGVPGAVAAAMRCPDRQVVCAIGDGSFLMTGSELALAVERKLDLCIVLSHNHSYGSIRVQQEREFPGRVEGTNLSTADFAMLGRAFGCKALVIEREEDVERVLEDALASKGPVLVEVKASLSAMLPNP